MSKNVNSSPQRHDPLRPRKTAQLVNGPQNAVKFTKECQPMGLGDAMVHFDPFSTKAFRVSEGVYCSTGCEGVATGDIFVVYLKKQELSLKVVSSPGNDPVTVSGTSLTEFALTPPAEEGDETDIKKWEGLYSSVTKFLEATKCQSLPMPEALKVLDNVVDHNGQLIPAQTLLFNICKVSQWVGLRRKSGIEGVDCSGTVHRFLEGEDPLFFSTRLHDVKCIPLYFAKVVQFPKTAKVYRHPNTEEGEEANSLQNLSTITIAEVSNGKSLVVRKLSDCGDKLGPTFTIPLNADMKVVAVRLPKGHLLDSTSNQRCMTKSRSCPNLAVIATQEDVYVNPYFDDPYEATRGDIQAGRKMDHGKEACYNMDTLKLKQDHKYGTVPGTSPVDVPMIGVSDPFHVMTGDIEMDDKSDSYAWKYMDDSWMTGVHQSEKIPLLPGNPQGLSVPSMNWKKRKYNVRDVVSTGNSPVAQARKADGLHSPSSLSKQHWQGRGKDDKLTDRPQMRDLQLMVVPRVAAQWYNLGLQLGFRDFRLNTIRSNYGNVEDHSRELFSAWLNGERFSGDLPRTWAALLDAVKQVGGTKVMEELSEEIESELGRAN